jgi:hypothetical protein
VFEIGAEKLELDVQGPLQAVVSHGDENDDNQGCTNPVKEVA